VETQPKALKDTYPYPWPALNADLPTPIWTGQGFQVGTEIYPVLPYEAGISGWTDDLTYFHEENAEGDHLIDRASRRHGVEQLLKHLKNPAPVILEVGSSSGFMLPEIRKNFPRAFLIGSDYVYQPLEKLAKNVPDLPLIQMNLVKCPLPSNSVDAVVALNVLEHIEDDLEAARQINRILKPGGVAVIEVPAGPKLYDVYDELLMHYRRYTRRSIAKLFKDAGFEVVENSHLGFFMYPAFCLVKQRNKRFLTKEKLLRQEVVAKNIRNTKNSRLLKLAIQLETGLGKWVSYPFGIRSLITCIKR
jgi:SAM-dependent methyltransferase